MSDRRFQKWMDKFPAVSDLAHRARQRIPHVAWEYLETGTGDEDALSCNREAFQAIKLMPQIFRGLDSPDLSTGLLGKKYKLPFGIAPAGLTGLMWPRAEQLLAATAVRYQIPFCLSTVATQPPEALQGHIGDMGWFQLYPPRDPEIRRDLLRRARESGFHTLVLTADVATPSRRERTKRAGLNMPPRITARFIREGITHPCWTLATLQAGLPRIQSVDSYVGKADRGKGYYFLRDKFGGSITWDYVRACRDEWEGPFVIKGILRPEDANKAMEIGADGIIVSNHGGRQFDAAPAALDVLPGIVGAVGGRVPVMYDSGIRSGIDVIKAMALGADFVFLGRAFLYGTAALGTYGGDHVCEILREELVNNMIQLGCPDVASLRQVEIVEG